MSHFSSSRRGGLARLFCLLLSGLLPALLAGPAAQAQCANPAGVTRLYVNAAVGTPGTGDTWATAYASLGEALEQARTCADIAQVWVAAGTYVPTRHPDGSTTPANARDKTFVLRSGLAVYGGFAGSETALTQRVAGNVTTLSGDLNGDDATLGTADNVYHVLVSANTATAAPTLDGVTVRAGRADGSGGFTVNAGSVSRNRGAGLYNVSSSPVLTNCVFSANSSISTGGGLYNASSSPVLTNCVFSANASSSGGGLYNASSSSPVLTNCTLSGNSASNMGSGAYYDTGSGGSLTNCVLRNNASGNMTDARREEVYKAGTTATLTISHSFVRDFDGAGITNVGLVAGTISAADPLLRDATDPDGPDNLFGTSDDGLALQAGSPARNFGSTSISTPATDLTGYARGAAPFDAGAYEFNPCLLNASRLYVNAAVGTPGAGGTWATAYASLGEALEQARVCALVAEVWVAAGTYVPTRDPGGNPAPADPRDKTFVLRSGLAVYGGFAGSETALTQRVAGNVTTLSGDLNGDDATQVTTDNVYHVLVSAGTATAPTLDGVTVRAGRADGTGAFTLNGRSVNRGHGGGLYNVSSSPVLTGCVFSANGAAFNGGGLYNVASSSPVLTNCVFSANASSSGGGLYNASSSPVLTNCVFSGNSASGSGGGLYNVASSSPELINCTLSGNSAGNLGSGAYYDTDSGGSLTNCVLRNATTATPTDDNREEVYKAGTATQLVLHNCFVRDLDVSQTIVNANTTRTVGTDPLLRDAADPDGLDNLFGTSDDGLALQAGSPARNFGSTSISTPATDLTGYARGAAPFDAGAYEFNPCALNVSRLYVNAAVGTPGAGGTWATAYASLGAALEQARTCADIAQVWVAAGTYVPTRDPGGNPAPADPRDKTFVLRSGLAVYGGFAGSETTLAERVAGNVTTLSGDLNGDDATLGTADNVYHVLVSAGTATAAPTLDGVTVRAGRADNSTASFMVNGQTVVHDTGGGLHNISSSPVLTNCVFSGNNARFGGGMYNKNASSPVLSGCVFSANTSGNSGGGLYNTASSSPVLTNCVFSGNTSSSGGGLSNTAFSSPVLTNCVFSANTSSSGGALYAISSSSPVLTNCTLSGNSASNLGSGAYYGADSGGSLTNCVLRNATTATPTDANREEVYKAGTATSLLVSSSFVRDFDGAGITNVGLTAGTISAADPLLRDATDPDGPDNLFGTADDGLALQAGSPATDYGQAAGAPPADIRDIPHLGQPDAGAYENRLPALLAAAPAAELPGQAVLLTGTNFTAGTSVSFGGVAAASVSVISPSSLTAIVPVGATPGNTALGLTTAEGTASAPPTAFEVLGVYRAANSSGCLSTAGATLDGSGGPGSWRYLRLPGPGGAVVAAIEDTHNLGTVTAGLTTLGTSTAAPVRTDGRDRHYLDRNFFLTATNPAFPGQSVQVRFYGLSSELARLQAADANATPAGLKASQYSGANEDCDLANNDSSGERRLLAAPATVPAGADWFVAELAVTDHFSEFYLTGASAPLPVELTTFTAQAQGAAVALKWRTVSETNSNWFEVERSLDGRTFAKIGEQLAQGTKAGPTDYTYQDNQVPRSPNPQYHIYYRLRQVDLDGTFSYSSVRAVALSGKGADGLTLAPNPGRATTLSGATAGAVVTVYDALGRLVLTAPADATGTVRLVLPVELPAGVYLVRTGTHALRLAVE